MTGKALVQSLFGCLSWEERSALVLLPAPKAQLHSGLKNATHQGEHRLDNMRVGVEAFIALGGGGWPTCSNSPCYPKEMKTSISAELCGSYALNPFHFLPGPFTIFCFHSWLQNHLFLPICTSRPDTEPNTNPSNHSGGKLKSSVSMFSAVHGVYVYESYSRQAEL